MLARVTVVTTTAASAPQTSYCGTFRLKRIPVSTAFFLCSANRFHESEIMRIEEGFSARSFILGETECGEPAHLATLTYVECNARV